MLGAVGEVFAPTIGQPGAGTTLPKHGDGLGAEPGVRHLVPVCFGKIKMKAVSAFRKQPGCVGVTLLKLAMDLFANGVAAAADRRPHCTDQILGAGAKVVPHARNALLDDACGSASPTRVISGNSTEAGIGYQNRNTIRDLDAKERVLCLGHQPVGIDEAPSVWCRELIFASVYRADRYAVHLPDSDELGGGILSGDRTGQ